MNICRYRNIEYTIPVPIYTLFSYSFHALAGTCGDAPKFRSSSVDSDDDGQKHPAPWYPIHGQSNPIQAGFASGVMVSFMQDFLRSLIHYMF